MDGSMMDPMAATVAGPEPVKAAKIAQLKTVTIPSPPGIQPRRLFAQSVSLREMPPKSIRFPTRMNSGTARRVKELSPYTNLWVTTRERTPVSTRYVIPAERMENATGTPISINPNKTRNTSVIIPVSPPLLDSLPQSGSFWLQPGTRAAIRPQPRRY